MTSGKWEVTSILKVDVKRGLVYFLSTERHSTERHLYSVSFLTGQKKALVDDTKPGFWSASFSATAEYYVLSYNGPDIPYQELYSINSTKPIDVVNDNAALKTKLAQYVLPKVSYTTVKTPSGHELNVREVLPANFDPRKKYPVLFTPYGGPGAQEVSKSYYKLGYKLFLASDPELQYILVTVDNRGTGFKGREFRALVAGKLGKLEAEDQVFAARQWAAKKYVDKDHIAIWGWSYGGYLAAKVIETNSGVFSLGLSTVSLPGSYLPSVC